MRLLKKKPKNAISASQIKLWQACPRAWGYQYLDGRRSPPSDSQRLGTRVHEILEAWLKSGTLSPRDEVFQTARGLKYPGQIARAGMQYLPLPRTADTEVEFFLEYEGVVFHGFVDFVVLGRIGDHKTCSDFKWMLSEEDLRSDPQALMYSAYYFTAFPTHDTVDLSWIYYLTSGQPEAREVRTRFHVMDVIDLFNEIIMPISREILDAKNLQRNPKHCSRYGGCPHIEVCDVSPKERMYSHMNILEKFIQDNTSVPKAPKTLPEVPEVPKAVPEAAIDQMSRSELKDLAVQKGLVDAGCRYGLERLRQVVKTGVGDPPSAPSAPPPSAPSAPPSAPSAPPSAPDDEPDTLDEPLALEEKPALPKQIGTLFVDCVPLKGDCAYVSLSHVIVRAAESLPMDYRLVPDHSHGRAAGALCDLVALELEKFPDYVDIVCDSSIPEHRHCLAMLEGRASLVVRGLR